MGSGSHIGKVRKTNEDCYYTGENFWIIADGMGGYKGGDLASYIAVEETVKILKSNCNSGFNDYKKIINESFHRANKKIYDLSRNNDQCKGMGTTLTLAIYYNNKIYIGHVGDTRIYQVRDNQITLLTEDHSLVGELLKNGEISEQEARTHPQKNIITRALGTDEFIQVDLMEVAVQNGDIYILASDGLTNLVDSGEILKIAKILDPQKICEDLIQIAMDRGGHDNITVITVFFDDIPIEGVK